MTSRALSLTVVLGSLVAPLAVRAGVVNGGFETGDLTGWVGTRNAWVYGAHYGEAPPEGYYAATLPTGHSPQFTRTEIENFLGLSSGSLLSLDNRAIGGSAMMQLVNATAGEVLSFRFNIVSQQHGGNDFAFLSFGDHVEVVGRARDIVTPLPPYTFWEAGYRSYEYVFETDGTFELGFGLVDVGTGTFPTFFYVDDVKIVPEPATLAMLGVGLIAVIGTRLRTPLLRPPPEKNRPHGLARRLFRTIA